MFNSNFHIWGSVDVGHLSPWWGSKGVLVWWCSHHWKVFYDIEHCSHHWEFWPCFQKWAKAIFHLCHRHVITAAHCTKDKNKKRLDISWKSWFLTVLFLSFLPSQFTVRVGEWDLSDDDNYSVELPVTSIVAHPNFRFPSQFSFLSISSMSTQSFNFRLTFLSSNGWFQAKWILQWCCHIHSQTACPILTVSCFIWCVKWFFHFL